MRRPFALAFGMLALPFAPSALAQVPEIRSEHVVAGLPTGTSASKRPECHVPESRWTYFGRAVLGAQARRSGRHGDCPRPVPKKSLSGPHRVPRV